MAKIHPYSRREFRRRLAVWVRRNLKGVATVTAGAIVLVMFVVVLIAWSLPAAPFTWWLLGATPTAVVAVYLHMIHSTFLASDAQAIWHLRGAWGEDNTRDVLGRAKRKKLVWGWVDSLELQYGDIDHLVVSRQGGLIAIDSKWRSNLTDATDMAKAAQKVRLRAEGLTRDLLKGGSRGSRRAKVNPLSVTSVIVLWGAAQHDVPDRARVDGIDFVAGHSFMDWLARLEGQPVDKAAAEDVIRTLEVRRDIAPSKTRPPSRRAG